jgi:3-isopropylmalate/(R)-2-methylmalate dehydratase small subunit
MARNKQIIRKIQSRIVPLPMENVDTDQIIPARFLKGITNEGYGEFLFRDWRFNDDGTEKENFVLNDKTYKGEVLVTGPSFGIGSSREHAAWAIADYGFRVVVSSQFGDNFLLAVEVSPKFINELFTAVDSDPEVIIDVDLETQIISIPSKGLQEKFDINPYKRMCLMNGYDDIDYILSKQKEVEEFEKNRKNDYSI